MSEGAWAWQASRSLRYSFAGLARSADLDTRITEVVSGGALTSAGYCVAGLHDADQLSLLEKHGYIERGTANDAACFLSSRGRAELVIGSELHSKVDLCKPRQDYLELELESMTAFELIHALETKGWECHTKRRGQP
eukprot:9867021-Lingulodinium_polyedra.AAC.1